MLTYDPIAATSLIRRTPTTDPQLSPCNSPTRSVPLPLLLPPSCNSRGLPLLPARAHIYIHVTSLPKKLAQCLIHGNC